MVSFDTMSNSDTVTRTRPTIGKGNVSEDGLFNGDGMVRNKGVSYPRVTLPTHLSVADPTVAQEALSEAGVPGVYPNITHPNKARKTKLAVLGIPSSILAAGSQDYARTVRLAKAYKNARQRELFTAHGYVSSGVGALLSSASLALSASRFLYELAANTPVQPDERGNVSLPAILKMASSLSDSYRQNELSAWELCAREAVIRKRNATDTVQVPWMTVETPSGQVKRGPGRPRKVSILDQGLYKAERSEVSLLTCQTQTEAQQSPSASLQQPETSLDLDQPASMESQPLNST